MSGFLVGTLGGFEEAVVVAETGERLCRLDAGAGVGRVSLQPSKSRLRSGECARGLDPHPVGEGADYFLVAGGPGRVELLAELQNLLEDMRRHADGPRLILEEIEAVEAQEIEGPGLGRSQRPVGLVQ